MSPRGATRRWVLLLMLAAPVVLFGVIAGWTRTVSSPDFCASCHEMEPAVESAAQALHAELPCLACHGTSGAVGALAYLPHLGGQVAQVVSGQRIGLAKLPTVGCDSCHLRPVASRALLAEGHPDQRSPCASCHGVVVHPEPEPSPEESHAPQYVQLHGRDALDDLEGCATCHQRQYCLACHVRVSIPHPDDWLGEHGLEQVGQGAETCQSCHSPRFCASCHGTEIPHDDTWLGAHYRRTDQSQETLCLTCHVQTDCASCHTKHGIHREQDLHRN